VVNIGLGCIAFRLIAPEGYVGALAAARRQHRIFYHANKDGALGTMHDRIAVVDEITSGLVTPF
jgi:hypothetical protein